MFTSAPHGFFLDFENGLCLSTQFGHMNYCENRESMEHIINRLRRNVPDKQSASKDAEVAILFEGNFITKKVVDSDYDVIGYVCMNQWLDIIEKCKNFNTDTLK
jgi:hypothetical protein